MGGWLVGWVARFYGNITNSAPNWVRLGLGAELGNMLIQTLKFEEKKRLVIIR